MFNQCFNAQLCLTTYANCSLLTVNCTNFELSEQTCAKFTQYNATDTCWRITRIVKSKDQEIKMLGAPLLIVSAIGSHILP